MDLGPNPGTDPIRDAQRVLGLIFGTRPAPPAPQPVASAEAPVRARNELIVMGLTPALRARAEAQGFAVLSTRTAPGGTTTARLRLPPGVTPQAGLDRLRALDPGLTVDRNHLYRPGSGSAAPGAQAPALQIAWPDRGCGQAPLIGLVDTGVDPAHRALRGAAIERVTVRDRTLPASGRAHGTAVAALLVGQGPDGTAPGLLPRAQLIAVDAFHRRADGDAADAFDLAGAIQILAAHRVSVANLSIAGPPNAVLERAGAEAAAAGLLLVAAAGNAGPDAPAQFPAAYRWAVAVTAVDARGEAYARAVRGPHIAFAAPGVGVPLPGAQSGTVFRTGTSFAAPFATAALALARAEQPAAGREATLRRLARAARDLGPPGRDAVFGWGLVQAGGLCRQGAVAQAG